MKTLLVYPGFADGFNSYRAGANWFHHGTGIISALLKKAGHEVVYLDCRKLTGWEEAEAAIGAADFETALISVATVDFNAARRLAALVKKKSPRLRVIVGGPHATLMTEETSGVPEFDHVFTHEAEVTLPRMLENLPAAPRIVRGEMPPDLDALPFVDRTLAPEGEYTGLWDLPRPYFSITASRGCLYNCSFCQPAERAVFGNKVRRRGIDNVLDELEYLAREHGMKSFMIHDDCFTQYYDWVQEFCEKKKARGLDQPFVCQSRADIICRRPDLLERLRAAGLTWAYIGFESGSDRVLQFIRKGVTVAQNLEAAAICRRLGIKIFANYMFGLPTETKEEMAQTVRMIQAIRPDIYSPAVFTPAPGSDLYTYCQERGLSLITTPEAYRRNAGSGAKIKGVDYACVDRMIRESMKVSLWRRAIRKIASLTAAIAAREK